MLRINYFRKREFQANAGPRQPSMQVFGLQEVLVPATYTESVKVIGS